MYEEDIIPLTDDRGRPLLAADSSEPEPASVVLVNGPFGQAWQRRFDDGLWHCTGGGRGRDWERMLKYRNLVLVYDAEPRPQPVVQIHGSVTGRIIPNEPQPQWGGR